MPIDFQPISQSAEAPAASAAPSIDFKPLESSAPTHDEGTLGKVYAGAQGIATGSLEGIASMGTLANNVLKAGAHLLYGKDSAVEQGLDVAGKIGEAGLAKLKGAIEPTPGFAQNAIAQNPQLYGAGATLGNVGVQTGLMNKALTPIANELNPLINKFAPGIAANPIASNAISQGTLGAGIGAASNPNNPIQGALAGGTIGAVAGGLGGAIAEPITTSGKIIDETVNDMVQQGKDPTSLASLRVLQKNLKDEGVEYRKYDIEQEARARVNDLMDRIRPDGYQPGTSPISMIANKTIQNAENVKLQNAANYKPINEATQEFTPSTYNAAVAQVKDNLPKTGLPTNEVLGSSTLNGMLENRKLLDGTIKQVQAQVQNGKVAQSKLLPYYQVRQALNQDIQTSAQSIGLGDTLKQAESFNRSNVQPFKTINKAGQIVDNAEAETKIWSNISAQLQARRPNYTSIRANAARLGPDGKELLGWGMIENALNRSTAIEGKFKPESMQSVLTRMHASGILDELGTDTQKSVALGISNVLESAARVKPAAPQVGMIGSKIQMLTHSRAGIALLRRIGSPSSSAETARTLTQQLLTGLLANKVASPQ